jgi:hypothetical protein
MDSSAVRPKQRIRLGQIVWFVLLWCVGVLAAGMLTAPFHFLVRAAMHST